MATRSHVEFAAELKPTWCPGCGDYGVLSCMFKAMAEMNLAPENVALITGIGCSSRVAGFVNAYGFNAVHGRALPMALGVKMANPNLTVVAAGGDGDGFAIGGGHIPHIARKNLDITYIVMDNQNYGLTKGQVSPTSMLTYESGTTPYGSIEMPLNPIALALTYGASFVARAYSSNVKETTDLIAKGIKHPGFAFLQVLSPCPVFNKVDTFKAFSTRVQPMPEGWDPSNRVAALTLALTEEKVHLGVFYQVQAPTYEARWEDLRAKAKGEGHASLEALVQRYL